MLKKSIYNKKKIPLKLYKKIIGLMPICCVDAVFKSGNKVFLFKRAYEPAKNEWWLIGGRVLKGETLKDAVIRKVKEEAGVEVNILKIIGVYETFFKISRFKANKKRISTHTISVCFVVKPIKKGFKLKLNEEYDSYKAITKVERNLHPYIKAVLMDSGLNLKCNL